MSRTVVGWGSLLVVVVLSSVVFLSLLFVLARVTGGTEGEYKDCMIAGKTWHYSVSEVSGHCEGS